MRSATLLLAISACLEYAVHAQRAPGPGSHGPSATAQSEPAVAHLSVHLGSVETDLTFAGLVHAPNGHISFLARAGGLDVWVAGKPPDINQGSYYYRLNSWSELSTKQPTRATGIVAPQDTSGVFDQNYLALNSVVQVPGTTTLLGFLDAEFHPSANTPNVFLSSIGMATSVDGVHWVGLAQILRGIDDLDPNKRQQMFDAMKKAKYYADGASGPSALLREDDVTRQPFVYVYFSDRDPVTAQGKASDIYVARAAVSRSGVSKAALLGSWQKWNGTTWTSASDDKPRPVLSMAQASEPVQPEVSWNTALNQYLMVFLGTGGFYASTSRDGLSWSTPELVMSIKKRRGQHIAYPSFLDLSTASQQVTGASGYLVYGEYGPVFGGQYRGVQFDMSVVPSLGERTPPVSQSPCQGRRPCRQ